MKNLYKLLLAALLLTAALPAGAQSVMRMKGTDCGTWSEKAFAKGKIPPFSFVYGDITSGEFIRKWNYEVRNLTPSEQGVTKRAYIYTDPKTGLQVECRVKTFADFNAMEWVLHFRNTSGADTPTIEQVKVVDLSPESAGKGGYLLHYADGSHASKEDFHARRRTLAVGDNHYMHPQGGRSSSHGFPFFNMQMPGGGIVVAIGWTGNWHTEITRTGENRVDIMTGMKNLATYLRPGEEIRTPSTAMIVWQGTEHMDGQNTLRRFLLAHHHPKIDGKPAVFPICSSFNYGDPAPCNEYSCLTSDYAVALVKRYRQFGLVPETFWLDAGWYSKAADGKHGYNWANTVGNWSVDTERFPDGLGTISDEVHKTGCNFMVWFEPERVMKDSDWAMRHPEFMLDASGQAAQPGWVKRGSVDSFLFNLGDPAAHKWFCEQVAAMIRDNRIDYYRQDFNIDPEGFWYSNDEPGRTGICEIRYIEGLYAFWDYLRTEFPGLLIDNCASGGRRIDLESASRSAPLWRTDYSYGEPVGYQCHTYGLNMWLPVHGTGTQKSDPFTFRSSLGATIVYNWKITNTDSSIPEMQQRMAEFAAVRPYFYEDYYPLTGYGDMTGDDIWLAYQLHRPSDQTGFLVAFRRDLSPDTQKTVSLRGLDTAADYILTNVENGDRVEATGRQLTDGFTLTMGDVRSSLLVKYEKQ